MDNSFIIDNLLEQQTGDRLEFQPKLEIDTIGRVITSFVNGHGGDLIIGVNDKKEIIGVPDADSTCENIRITLVENIKPTVPIAVQTIFYKGKDVILISVWEGGKKPYQYNGSI
jgi:ATP-dependent DNA helicase RecG